MAKQKNNGVPDDSVDNLTAFESKLVNLLALLLVQERAQTVQIDLLNRAGFGSAQIAALIGTTRNTVSVALSIRNRGKRSKSKATKK